LQSASIGVIASTGWDSFTVSSLEIAATAVPLVVSKLLGLEETVLHNETGLHFPPGDHVALADAISALADNDDRRRALGVAARARVLEQFTTDHQVASLAHTLSRFVS
jgi:glycosyltransferase involved in cell wall biosynthesis